MALKVRILNGKVKNYKIKKYEQAPKILTNQYIKFLNQGISFRIEQNQNENTQAVFSKIKMQIR